MDSSYSQDISSIANDTRPFIIIFGAGVLGEEYAKWAIGSGNNVLWYNRDQETLEAKFRDISHGKASDDGGTQYSTTQPVHITGSTQKILSKILNKNGLSIDNNINHPYYSSLSLPDGSVAIATSNLSMIDELMSKSSVVFFTIGKSEVKAGQDDNKMLLRNTLLEENANIVENFSPLLSKAKSAIHIVAPNPNNVIAKKYLDATKLPPEKIVAIGGTLDIFRLKSVISDELMIAQTDIENAMVLGNHGPDMIVPIEEIKIKKETGNISIDQAIQELVSRYETNDMSILDLAAQYKNELKKQIIQVPRQIVETVHRGTESGPVGAATMLTKLVLSDNKQPIVATIFPPADVRDQIGQVFLSWPAEISSLGVTPKNLPQDILNKYYDDLQKSAGDIKTTSAEAKNVSNVRNFKFNSSNTNQR